MSKERLTEKSIGCFGYRLKDGSDAEVGFFKDYGAFYSHMMVVKALGEYEELEERLEKMFGGKLPLKKYVDELEFALKEPDSPHPMNARILTYAESDKWDEYCKLEEKGLLLRLPCPIGTKVYYIQKCLAPSCKECLGFTKVDNCYTQYKARIFEQEFDYRHLKAFGESVFLTQSEAEEKLRELEGK